MFKKSDTNIPNIGEITPGLASQLRLDVVRKERERRRFKVLHDKAAAEVEQIENALGIKAADLLRVRGEA
jgi:hypothetical protein